MPINPLIAVVEDDDSVREATTGLLRSNGFIVKGFSSADEFLRYNRIHITSCLVADVQMPEMSGLALYGHLVAIGAPIPTILITAYPDDAVRARALSAGVTGCLVSLSAKRRCSIVSIPPRNTVCCSRRSIGR